MQTEYEKLAAAAETKYGIPTGLLRGLITQESGWDPQATSKAGAVGLGQFMPATAVEMGLASGERGKDGVLRLTDDRRTNPTVSIEAAAAYLKKMHASTGDWSMATAAYNAGLGKVRGVERDNQLFADETLGYVPAVARHAAKYGYQGGVSTAWESLVGKSAQAFADGRAKVSTRPMLAQAKTQEPAFPTPDVSSMTDSRSDAPPLELGPPSNDLFAGYDPAVIAGTPSLDVPGLDDLIRSQLRGA